MSRKPRLKGTTQTRRIPKQNQKGGGGGGGMRGTEKAFKKCRKNYEGQKKKGTKRNSKRRKEKMGRHEKN